MNNSLIVNCRCSHVVLFSNHCGFDGEKKNTTQPFFISVSEYLLDADCRRTVKFAVNHILMKCRQSLEGFYVAHKPWLDKVFT